MGLHLPLTRDPALGLGLPPLGLCCLPLAKVPALFHPLCALHVGSALDLRRTAARPAKRARIAAEEGGDGGGAALYCDKHALQHGHAESSAVEEVPPRPTELAALPRCLKRRLAAEAAAADGASSPTGPTTPPLPELLKSRSTPRSKILLQAQSSIDTGKRHVDGAKVLVIFLQTVALGGGAGARGGDRRAEELPQHAVGRLRRIAPAARLRPAAGE